MPPLCETVAYTMHDSGAASYDAAFHGHIAYDKNLRNPSPPPNLPPQGGGERKDPRRAGIPSRSTPLRSTLKGEEKKGSPQRIQNQHPVKAGQLLLLTLVYVTLAALLAKVTATFVVGGVLLCLLVILLLMDLRIGLALLPVSIALSPEFSVGSISLRLDDLLLAVMIPVWLARSILLREKIPQPPLTPMLSAFLFINIAATLYGLTFGNTTPFLALFRNLKYLEYILIFHLAYHLPRTEKDNRVFVWISLAASGLLGIFGLIQHLTTGHGVPITGPRGEDYNIFAGYLLIHVACAAGLWYFLRDGTQRLFVLAIIALLLYDLVFTQSRTSYLAFLAIIVFLSLHRDKKLLFFLAVFLVSYPFFFFFFRYILPKAPFLGLGLGSASLTVDCEYIRILWETGLVGMVAFGRIILSIVGSAKKALLWKEAPFSQGLAMGVLAGVVALLVHSLGATSFSTIRTASSFWLLCGLLFNRLFLIECHSPQRHEES
ncbi:MAG: hypothetical protein HYU64_10675 [Armatimonadetes bacterium]|nr:hypothetical protein [Armatimonadota bacterium]